MTDASDDAATSEGTGGSESPEPAPLGHAVAFVAGAAALFAVVAFFLADAREAVSVVLGGGLVAFDAWALGRIWRAILSDDPTVSRGLWVALALLKLAAVFGALWLLLSHGVLTPLGTAAGIAALPAGLVAFSLVADRGTATRKRDS